MCKVAPVSVFVTRKSPIYILAILHGEQYSVFTFPFPVEVSVIVNSVGALHPECQRCLHRPLRLAPGLRCNVNNVKYRLQRGCGAATPLWYVRTPDLGIAGPRKTGRFSRDTALDHKISVIYDFNTLKRRFVKDSFVTPKVWYLISIVRYLSRQSTYFVGIHLPKKICFLWHIYSPNIKEIHLFVILWNKRRVIS